MLAAVPQDHSNKALESLLDLSKFLFRVVKLKIDAAQYFMQGVQLSLGSDDPAVELRQFPCGLVALGRVEHSWNLILNQTAQIYLKFAIGSEAAQPDAAHAERL